MILDKIAAITQPYCPARLPKIRRITHPKFSNCCHRERLVFKYEKQRT